MKRIGFCSYELQWGGFDFDGKGWCRLLGQKG